MFDWNIKTWATTAVSLALLASAISLEAAPGGNPGRGQGNSNRGQAAQAPRSYVAAEADLTAHMRRLLETREEIARLRREAQAKDREVAEAKSSQNVISRIMLPRRLEEYHALLKSIDEREAEERRLAERVRGLADDAYSALREEGETPEKRARLGVLSGRDLERASNDLDTATAKLGRSDNAAERAELAREIERLQSERARARRELYKFYSIPLN
jgi:chromosome segregation ATPase